MNKITCGIDWAEAHHDVALVDENGQLVAKRRIAESVTGFAELTTMLAEAGDSAQDPIAVGIETPRGLLVAALRATGRPIYPINPMAAARYRERHSMSGKKSDHADAVTLANILRTDAHAHRPLPADTQLARSIAVLARAHQDATWRRTRASNELRSLLREYYPGFLAAFAGRTANLTCAEARAVLAIAPTPAQAAALSKPQLAAALRRAGRKRGINGLAAQLQTALRVQQLRQPELVETAFGVQALALLATLNAECVNVEQLGQATAAAFTQHRDHAIITSFPGLGDITGARVLAEIGDDRRRFADARSLKAFAGSAPVTKASGRTVCVTHRRVKNNRLAAVGFTWAFRRGQSRRARARPLPGPARARRPARRRAPTPLQPPARPALPLPADQPDLRPGQGLPASHRHRRHDHGPRRCLTFRKIGGLWIGRRGVGRRRAYLPGDRVGLSSRPALERRSGRYAHAQGSADGIDGAVLGGGCAGRLAVG